MHQTAPMKIWGKLKSPLFILTSVKKKGEGETLFFNSPPTRTQQCSSSSHQVSSSSSISTPVLFIISISSFVLPHPDYHSSLIHKHERLSSHQQFQKVSFFLIRQHAGLPVFIRQKFSFFLQQLYHPIPVFFILSITLSGTLKCTSFHVLCNVVFFE